MKSLSDQCHVTEQRRLMCRYSLHMTQLTVYTQYTHKHSMLFTAFNDSLNNGTTACQRHIAPLTTTARLVTAPINTRCMWQTPAVNR